MRTLSEEGQRIISEIGMRHGVSTAAVAHLLVAVMAGNGTQAQFNHPELGGMGQWSQGGMIMVGDMFNNGLKARVDALCNELSALIRTNDFMAPASGGSHQSQYQGSGQQQQQGGQYQGGQYQGQGDGFSGHQSSNWQSQGSGASLFVPGTFQQNGGWPAELGSPSSSGAQNNLRYAFFPGSRRLAIDLGGTITVYDTRDHQIGGFSQQQGGDQSLTFTSQYGLVRVADLEIVSPVGEKVVAEPAFSEPAPTRPEPAVPVQTVSPQTSLPPTPTQAYQAELPASAEPAAAETVPFRAADTVASDDIIDKIERLAGLHAKGILTDGEFQAKKAELLSRL